MRPIPLFRLKSQDSQQKRILNLNQGTGPADQSRSPTYLRAAKEKTRPGVMFIGWPQSPQMRLSVGRPHAADLHPGQTNLARVGAFGLLVTLPVPLPLTGSPGSVGEAMKRPLRSTYWMPHPSASRSAAARANGPSSTMKCVICWPVRFPPGFPVLVGVRPISSILVPHSTLWYPARLGLPKWCCQAWAISCASVERTSSAVRDSKLSGLKESSPARSAGSLVLSHLSGE